MTREELMGELNNNIPDISKKQVWIWGTGHTTNIYLQGLKRMKNLTICGFCDNNQAKWGCGANWKVISPDELYKIKNVFVVISSWQKTVCESVKKQLDEHNIESMPIDEFIFKMYRLSVMECYDSFYDQESRDTYAHLIHKRVNVDMPEDKFVSDKQYFLLRAFRRYGKAVFVDCGAYVGDSIERFIWNMPSFEKIYGFEPDKGNFKAMQKRCDRLKQEWNLSDGKIELHNVAVGAKNEVQPFSATSSMGSVILQEQIGNEVTNVVALDDILHEKYTFLKADIESYEYDMLLGAEKSIKKWQPNLAISIYHNAIDMISILPLVKKINPTYKFAVRHHSVTYDETVLYAWVKENENGWIQ